MSKKDQYVKTLKHRLDEWNTEIDDLEAKAHKTQGDIKERYQEQLAALRAKCKKGEEKLEALRAASEDRWEELKKDTEHVWEAVKDSAHHFRSHFK